MPKPIYLSDIEIEETLTEQEARFLEAHGLVVLDGDLHQPPDATKYIINHDIDADNYDEVLQKARNSLAWLRMMPQGPEE